MAHYLEPRLLRHPVYISPHLQARVWSRAVNTSRDRAASPGGEGSRASQVGSCFHTCQGHLMPFSLYRWYKQSNTLHCCHRGKITPNPPIIDPQLWKHLMFDTRSPSAFPGLARLSLADSFLDTVLDQWLLITWHGIHVVQWNTQMLWVRWLLRVQHQQQQQVTVKQCAPVINFRAAREPWQQLHVSENIAFVMWSC